MLTPNIKCHTEVGREQVQKTIQKWSKDETTGETTYDCHWKI